MKISQKGINLIKKYEGLELKPYLCPTGHWTIGWGRIKHVTSKGVMWKDTFYPEITEGIAEELLRDDLARFEKAVNEGTDIEPNQNQFDAMVSFAFNVGIGSQRGRNTHGSGFQGSTLRKRFNEGKFHAVPAQFKRWNKGRVKGKLVVLKGLVRRRKEEANLFASPYIANAKPKPLIKSRTLAGAVIAGAGEAISKEPVQDKLVDISLQLKEASATLQEIQQLHEYIAYVSTALVIGGIGLAIYARISDQRSAKRA